MTVSIQNGRVESQLWSVIIIMVSVDLNSICRLKLIRVNVAGPGLQISK